jgi:hypothetical protein
MQFDVIIPYPDDTDNPDSTDYPDNTDSEGLSAGYPLSLWHSDLRSSTLSLALGSNIKATHQYFVYIRTAIRGL